MSDKSILISKRYAKAFFESYSLTRDQASEELSGFVKIIEQNSNLKGFLESDVFSIAEKKQTLEAILQKGSFSKDLQTFIELVIEAGRAILIPQISLVVENLVNQEKGVEDVLLESAKEISTGDVHRIQARLERNTGKKIRLNVKISPELIAGLRAFVGGQIIEASLKSNLESLKKDLLSIEF